MTLEKSSTAFAAGDRVAARKNGDMGSVREIIAQRHADDLYVVSWDTDPDDHELYAQSALMLVRHMGSERAA